MDRKALKQRGKALFGGHDLFKSKYWQSVLVTLFMLFSFGSFIGPKFEFNFDDTDAIFSSFNSANSFADALLSMFGGGVTIAVILSSIFSVLLSIFVICTFKAGGIRYFLKSRKNNPTDFKEVFQNFKDKTFLNIGKISFCKFGFTYLWSLLFVIPGIIKSYEYWAIDYIVATRPDIERHEVFRLSKILMDGHKWDLFVLQLSFIGWNILDGFTSGILGIFYVSPYQQATYVEFFSDLRLEALAKGAITPYDIPDYEAFAPANQNPPYGQGYAEQYNNPYAQQDPQNYGGFAQPNPQPTPQPDPQFASQPFAQPVDPQPSVTPQAPVDATVEAPVEAPQNEEKSPIEVEFEPVTSEETQE